MNTRGSSCRHPVGRHVVELVAEPLADLIDRPPRHFLHVQRIWAHDALRGRDQPIDRDVAGGDAFVGSEVLHLDIDAHEIAALPGDDDDVALVGGLDERLHANVGEIGHSQDIHHAPGLIGRISGELAAEGIDARRYALRRNRQRSAPLPSRVGPGRA